MMIKVAINGSQKLKIFGTLIATHSYDNKSAKGGIHDGKSGN